MLKSLKIAFQVIWATSMIVLATTTGSIYGWQHHGVIGAVALGFVGLVFGALLAASPMLFLELLQ